MKADGNSAPSAAAASGVLVCFSFGGNFPSCANFDPIFRTFLPRKMFKKTDRNFHPSTSPLWVDRSSRERCRSTGNFVLSGVPSRNFPLWPRGDRGGRKTARFFLDISERCCGSGKRDTVSRVVPGRRARRALSNDVSHACLAPGVSPWGTRPFCRSPRPHPRGCGPRGAVERVPTDLTVGTARRRVDPTPLRASTSWVKRLGRGDPWGTGHFWAVKMNTTLARRLEPALGHFVQGRFICLNLYHYSKYFI